MFAFQSRRQTNKERTIISPVLPIVESFHPLILTTLPPYNEQTGQHSEIVLANQPANTSLVLLPKASDADRQRQKLHSNPEIIIHIVQQLTSMQTHWKKSKLEP